jgi:hypothetical protein
MTTMLLLLLPQLDTLQGDLGAWLLNCPCVRLVLAANSSRPQQPRKRPCHHQLLTTKHLPAVTAQQ